MGGKTTFDGLIAAGKAKLKAIASLRPAQRHVGQFTPDFELMPGTSLRRRPATKPKDPFEVLDSNEGILGSGAWHEVAA
jgi:hypothetical protein